MGLLGEGLSGIAALLDYFSTQEHNRATSGWRQEGIDQAQAALDQFGAPRSAEDYLASSGLFDNQTDLTALADTQRAGALDWFNTNLDTGRTGVNADLASGLTGLHRQLGQDINLQNQNRMTLGSTFGLLGLDDPNQRYADVLHSGNETAAANMGARAHDLFGSSFDEQARVGTDPFEAGAMGDSRRRISDQLYGDYFNAGESARNARETTQQFNVGARNTALAGEEATNRNIDSAIASLQGSELGAEGGLYNTRMTRNAGLLENLGANYSSRLSGIDQSLFPALVGQEAGNRTLAQTMHQSDVDQLVQYLADLQQARQYDPWIGFQRQAAVGNLLPGSAGSGG